MKERERSKAWKEKGEKGVKILKNREEGPGGSCHPCTLSLSRGEVPPTDGGRKEGREGRKVVFLIA